MKITNCHLCRVNPADKTGSHIVPHFLLKRIENVDGKTGRDYELGFVIQEFDTTSHFGRSVPVSKLDEIFGELTDQELLKNTHPLVVDHFFCQKCENRFAKIESEYAKTLNIHDTKVYSTGISSELGLLFWMSVIWRISINGQNGVQLSKSQNEKLRRVLDRCLKDDYSKMDYSELRNLKEAKRISYRLIRCPNFSLNNISHLTWHPKFLHPYALVIDEFILFFAFKDNFNDFTRMDFLGFKGVLNAPINKFDNEEQIMPVDKGIMDTINSGLIHELKRVRLERIHLFLDTIHKKLGGRGRAMPVEIKQEIFAEITSEEKKMGRKHNSEDLINSTYKILRKYGST